MQSWILPGDDNHHQELHVDLCHVVGDLDDDEDDDEEEDDGEDGDGDIKPGEQLFGGHHK